MNSDPNNRGLALAYHENPTPGKLATVATKPLDGASELALAYSPGVAVACEAIQQDSTMASRYTSRANLVAVVTNGTAVLGLGDIGPLAAKPVMEGKAVLFKKFAGIDAFDIELDETDVVRFCDIVCAMEPTFGGINLEDIKAPECFAIESELSKRMNIPVFHDDQHGTAIVTAAAIKNALRFAGKSIGQIKLVVSGAGAAALACLDLLVELGLPISNIVLFDSRGAVTRSRPDLTEHKLRYASDSGPVSLHEALKDCDVFLGLSRAGLVTEDMISNMSDRPAILALANPVPEIMPEQVYRVRPDAIVATGRSDYPNQVNNVLCFPFLFRGALDVGAKTVNKAMKIACVNALADLAVSDGPGLNKQTLHNAEPPAILPDPFDPRLFYALSSAVAQAAIVSGVASRPFDSLESYYRSLKKRMEDISN